MMVVQLCFDYCLWHKITYKLSIKYLIKINHVHKLFLAMNSHSLASWPLNMGDLTIFISLF